MDTISLERIEIQIPSDKKQVLSKAVEINESTLSAFVMSAAMDKAREILQAHQYFELTEAEWQSLMSALETPPEPNNYLKAAWDDSDEEYKRGEMTEQKHLGLRAELQAGVDELDNGLHKEATPEFWDKIKKSVIS